MEFQNIYTEKRVGSDKIPTGARSGFQRDFDRLIFSSAFRRLQNKTQVFPLPGTAFVHNRLTHSLEVASVGRSLGKMIGERISMDYKSGNDDAYEFYRYELANVIAAACLAHDIGNPAFGHSGEKAISSYFIENAHTQIEGQELIGFFNEKEWKDLTSFEGNANAVRVLTHSFKGRFQGGFGLTYTTIASILKYPCESTAVLKKYKHRKKYGFFQTEKETVEKIATELGMIPETNDPIVYKRHPFVYLVEAADDICYSIIDMEDAHRLGILPVETVRDAFIELINAIKPKGGEADKTLRYFKDIKDTNEAIAFVRARVINLLANAAVDVFYDNKEAILSGTFNDTLIDNIEGRTGALKTIQDISLHKIYGHDTVIQVEIAGYNVMSGLLQLFIPALLKEKPSHKEEKVLKLFPYQFTEFKDTSSKYEKVMNALDYLSGMTDEYATEIYRRLQGISIPRHG
ncbi:dGTP triphosphohydrolase [Flavisolibacter ginsengisoli]|jgi:dGTPase|uniref:dGTPase n=1 Tax=Flavisolibacter ginsengisoli DSM 18119 TaxID=1121884 RepID=A0A1M5A639_9BACT|nr:dNTP triphosphohydrolase [Flavisolibacter ginsengisoli]SHF25292.1 dGTPase [Flavisolibacter ginsengisoli DSM 18119]